MLVLAGCSSSSGDDVGTPGDAEPETTTADDGPFDATFDAGDSAVVTDSTLEVGDTRDAIPSDTAVSDADVAPIDPKVHVAYVGAGDGQISLFAFDETTGALTPKGKFAAGSNPSFLAFDVAHLRLFAVLDNIDSVASFSIEKGTGALTKLNAVPSVGGPTHLSLDRAATHVLVANYGAGTTNVFAVDADGTLGAVTDRKSPGALSHQIVADPGNAFVFVPCKGSDWVAQYVYDASKGTLTANATPHLTTAAGAGPRHLELHPSGKYAYLIDENDSTMMALAYDATKGTFTTLQTISTLPSGFDPSKNTAAEVHVAPSGRFVYGSNRGHDSIVVYAVDAATGKLTLVGHTLTTGKTPRHFSLDESGAFLLVANQGTSDVVVFRIDPGAGTLSKVSSTAIGAAAYFVGVASIPAK